MQQRFLLQILLLAQHVSGTTMPIIRSSRVLYSGRCLWYFVLWFSSCWSGVELRVMFPVCRMLQHPANEMGGGHVARIWNFILYELKYCLKGKLWRQWPYKRHTAQTVSSKNHTIKTLATLRLTISNCVSCNNKTENERIIGISVL